MEKNILLIRVHQLLINSCSSHMNLLLSMDFNVLYLFNLVFISFTKYNQVFHFMYLFYIHRYKFIRKYKQTNK